jgi:hypothetical protein
VSTDAAQPTEPAEPSGPVPYAGTPWSGTRKVATAGGVLLVVGIVLIAVAGTLLGRGYALRADGSGGQAVLATGSPAVLRGDLATVGGGAPQRVQGVGGDRLTAPPFTINGRQVAVPSRPGIDAKVPAGSVYLATAGVVPRSRIDGVVVATLRGSEFTGQPAATPFTAAGFGPGSTDSGLVRLLWLGVAGAAVLLLSLLVLAAAFLSLVVRHLSTRMDALAAEDEDSTGEPAEEPEPAEETP